MSGPELRGQVGIVTGSGRGIGREIALALARHGAHVVLTARTRTELEQVAAAIREGGGACTVVPADLTAESQVVGLFDRVRTELGRLDVLVNNAAIGLFGAVAEFPAEQFDRVMATNVRGPFLCCREAMRMMTGPSRGYIINIASVVGFKGYPNQAAYTASKHAVMGLTKSLAVEAQKHGIRVSAILPGGVDTGMVGDARPDLDRSVLLSPSDVAQAVLFLLSLSERAAIDQIYIRRRGAAPF